MNKILLLLIGAVVLVIISRFAISFFSANKVATGLSISDDNVMSLSGCDGLHNCTASTATSKRNHIEAFSYNGTGAEAMTRFSNLIASYSGATIVTQQANYLHATFKTTLLGYTDDFELLLDESNQVLHVRSASRIGKSDLGANRKRIEALRSLAKSS